MKRMAVIMAGGSGERFWPVSREQHPKQLLCLTDSGKTLLQEAVDRLLPLVPREHIYIQTMGHLQTPISAAGLGIPGENVIAEPCKRNTAGCLCYAVAHLLAEHGGDGADITMAVVPADPVVGDDMLFRETVEAALAAAEADPVLCTIGIVPDRPATGYGYIHAELPDGASPLAALPVRAFKEKPPRDLAGKYLASGDYFWNSGMFFWRISTFLDEFDRANPVFSETTRRLAGVLRAGDHVEAENLFGRLESISIDYALMEKARNVAMVRAAFSWDDVGTWSALERTRRPDEDGNITEGGPVLVDCHGSIVCNHAGPEKMAVGVVGLDDVVVVATEDAVLVVHKDRTEDVKQVVQALKKRNAPQR